jgi:catechol 2,3-dioxygenase-like lactoylglutathione lyase family enzyme
MITALDHIVMICPTIDAGEAAMRALLGRAPDWRSNDSAGSSSLVYRVENTAVELLAPAGGGPVARRLHALLDQSGPGLQTLVFSARNIAAFRTVMDRRGLKPDEMLEAESLDPFAGGVRSWTRIRLAEDATHGVRIFVLERRQPDPLVYKPAGNAAVSALDHVVVNTPQPERAAALYGARLGLRMALDRSNPDWDARLIFFRIGDVTVEIAHKISNGVSNAPDKLFGLTWRVPDIEAAHARIMAAGLPLTAIRAGRRPGTQVFSVREGTLGVPTLILGEEPAKADP